MEGFNGDGDAQPLNINVEYCPVCNLGWQSAG